MDVYQGLIQTAKSVVNGLAGLILFFITPTGVTVFVFLLLLYLGLKIAHSWKAYSLSLTAAGKKTSGAGYVFQKIGIFFLETAKFLGRIISNLPVLLSVIVIFLLIVGTAGLFKEFDQFMMNEKKIKEMRIVLKHLDKRCKVADMKVINQDDQTTTVRLDFFDYSGPATNYLTQELSIRGKDIYFDSLVLNFDYSEISEGTAMNIALPYRIFSEEVPQAEGIKLELEDDNGIPLLFKRSKEEIYGLNEWNYTARLKEILLFLTDEKAAREAGVRSIYGNAVHKKVYKGDFLSIWIEQTGGLVIKEEEEF